MFLDHIFILLRTPDKWHVFDRVGYHSIGIGHRHAVLKLVSLGQHQSKSINETVFNVYCAKRVAELAPGVGQATSMKIVTGQGTQSVEQDILDKLNPVFDEHSNPVNESVIKAVEQLPFNGKGGGHDSVK